MQQSSVTPKNRNVGIGLQKIVTCSQSSSQCLLVYTVFGMVSSLHPTLIFILVLLLFYAGLAFDTIVHGEMPYTCVRATYWRTNCNAMHAQSRKQRKL